MIDVPEPRKPRSWWSPTLQRLLSRVIRYGVPALLLLAFFGTCSTERETALCLVCGSQRLSVERGFGSDGGIVVPVWQRSERVLESETSLFAFDGQHRHKWRVRGFSHHDGFFATHGQGRSGWSRRSLVARLNGEASLRAWVKSEIASGVMTLERLQMLLEVPDEGEQTSDATRDPQRDAALRREILALLHRYADGKQPKR